MTALPEQKKQSQPTGPLWSPSPEKIEKALLTKFRRKIQDETGQQFDSYHRLWNWSVNNSGDFWSACWDFCDIIGKKGQIILRNADQMPGAEFFPESQLNYAENLLRRQDTAPAIIFRDEKSTERTLSFKELYDQVSLWHQALKASGVEKGDRIAACMPNTPETIIAALAASSLGAIWSSASPDFGTQGLLDRFGQIQPKILIATDGYYYNGKTINCIDKIKEIQPQIKGLEKTILVNFSEETKTKEKPSNTLTEKEFIGHYQPKNIQFEQLPFDHPLFIMFSSGTTGKPKCIVHGQGGTLLQHMKEHKLQCDIKPDDRIFYFTTCGWMMWNWLITALASEACIMLYDGSPFHPDGNMLWDYAEQQNCTFFGTSAKYIDALKSNDLEPGRTHNLSALRTIASTGSPLVHESFDYVYASIKEDVHLASVYGGTDIISASFGIGNPISPVWRGELQGPALGTNVDIFDENGHPKSFEGGPGDLVCKSPHPSMPVFFWNDEDGKRYHAAYFETFPGIWHHGDWVSKTSHHGLIVHGRSDATLNPGGVRIGTAEIYRQVEQIKAVQESIAVGQSWDDDVRVILFVILKEGHTLNETLIKDIKTRIRTGASPRHVPAKVIQVTDIPRTKSGKITELAVKDIIEGRPIKNKTALANPEALKLYENLKELKS